MDGVPKADSVSRRATGLLEPLGGQQGDRDGAIHRTGAGAAHAPVVSWFTILARQAEYALAKPLRSQKMMMPGWFIVPAVIACVGALTLICIAFAGAW